MIIDYARVSTTEQNLGLHHDDLKAAYDASVDVTDARKAMHFYPRIELARSAAEARNRCYVPGRSPTNLHVKPTILPLRTAQPATLKGFGGFARFV